MPALRDRLIARIRSDGPLPFEEFMRAALYDAADGFFGAGPLRSVKAGDFLTSPEVSPMFGEMLGRFVAAERVRLGDPEDFVVVDVGAGSGSLLRPLLASLDPVPEAWGVEASPAARRALGEVLPATRIVASLDGLPERLSGVIIANELLDNLPCALAVKTAAGWEERFVGAKGDDLILVPAPTRTEVGDWADRFAGEVPAGGMVEVQIEAGEWLRAAINRLAGGAAIVVDYGGTAEELEPRRTQGTLRTYRAHHLGPDPLREPGATDITADVNLSALLAVVAATGAVAELHRQDDFLADLGIKEVIRSLRREELALARDGNPMERLRLRSMWSEAETLLHPRGLGDFRVIVARK